MLIQHLRFFSPFKTLFFRDSSRKLKFPWCWCYGCPHTLALSLKLAVNPGMPKNKKRQTPSWSRKIPRLMRVGCLQGRFFLETCFGCGVSPPETNMAPENCDSFSFLKIQLSCQIPFFSFREGIFLDDLKKSLGFWFRCWHPEKGHPLWLPFEPGFKLKPCRRGPKRWTPGFPPVIHPSNKKPLKHGRRRIPKTWGATRPNKERGFFYERHCGMRTFRLMTGCFLGPGRFPFDAPIWVATDLWTLRGHGGLLTRCFLAWVFCCFKKTHPAGHTQRSDRRAIGAKGKELLMNFNTSEVADVKEKLWESPMETLSGRFPLYAAIGMGFHLCPLQGSFRKGREPSLRRVKSRIWVFPKIVVPQNGWLK